MIVACLISLFAIGPVLLESDAGPYYKLFGFMLTFAIVWPAVYGVHKKFEKGTKE